MHECRLTKMNDEVFTGKSNVMLKKLFKLTTGYCTTDVA